MKRKNGFTLIELLAVIIILAVIALIAVPQVIKILSQSKKAAFENSVNGLFKSSDNYIANFMLKNDGSIPEKLEFECNKDGCNLTDESKENLKNYNLNNLEKLNFKGKSPKSGTIKISENGKVIYVDSITDGTWCATGYIDGLTISKECIKVEEPNPGDEEIIDTTAPNVAPIFEAISTTNSITVNITGEAKDSESGIYGYQFSKDGGSTWEPVAPQSELVYTFYGLTSGSYDVNVRAINKTYPKKEIDETNTTEGTIQTVSTISLGSITEANATPSGYSQSKNVLVNFEGTGVYLIQPSVNVVANVSATLCTSVDAEYSCTDTVITAGNLLTPGGDIWYKVESDPILTYLNNGSLRYKIIDGTNMTEVGSINVGEIDTDAPDRADFEIIEITSDSITVKASGEDIESGIYGYQFSKDGGSTWEPVAPQESEIYIFSDLTVGTYTLKIKAINNTYLNNEINNYNTLESEMLNQIIEVVEPPIVELTVSLGSVSNYSTSNVTLIATATKGTKEISKYEFYNGTTLLDTVTTTSTTASTTINSLSTEAMDFKVIVYDEEGNNSESAVTESCSYNRTTSCTISTQYQIYTCTPTNRQYAISKSCSTTTTKTTQALTADCSACFDIYYDDCSSEGSKCAAGGGTNCSEVVYSCLSTYCSGQCGYPSDWEPLLDQWR